MGSVAGWKGLAALTSHTISMFIWPFARSWKPLASRLCMRSTVREPLCYIYCKQ